MRVYINGRAYDTETATSLGFRCTKCFEDDPNYHGETMFRKWDGEYFLYIHDYHSGHTIKPITQAEAEQWRRETRKNGYWGFGE